MKLQMKSRALIAPLALLVALASPVALATPTIVNISGTQNGENTGGVDCSVACEGTLIAPVQVTLGPGTYTITDAWSSAGFEPGALYDAWNFESGNPTAWAWHWKMLKDDGSNGSTINTSNYASFLLADVDRTQSFSTESAAANFGSSTAPTEFTLATATVLDFVVNDNILWDNAGGVSLSIACTGGACATPASSVSEPAGSGLFAMGLLALAGLARWRLTGR